MFLNIFVDIVLCLVPSCVICYFRDFVQKTEEVLRMNSNSRCKLFVDFSLHLASTFVGKFWGNGVCEI